MYSLDSMAPGPQATRVDNSSRIASLLPAIDKAAKEAGSRIAVLWPLTGSVAINPLSGVAAESLPGSAQTMARMLGARLTMPRAYYASLLESGRIGDEDIAEAIAELASDLGISTSVGRIRAEALQPDVSVERFQLPTVATLAARHSGVDWPELITGCISNWAAGYFDQGTAVWSAAPADAAPWPSYRAVASIDRSAELMGLKDARRCFAELPARPVDVLAMLAARLRLTEKGLVTYFHRLLADVAGWVGYANSLGWRTELRGEEGSAARQLLSIRAAWELATLQSLRGSDLKNDIAALRQNYLETDSALWRALFATDQVLQLASERAAQRRLGAAIGANEFPAKDSERPDIQAAFCIDVRSERIRRALETGTLSVETLGFAGFSGLPAGQHAAANQWSSRRARPQRSGVSGFDYVEALGLGQLWKLAKAALGATGTGDDCQHDGHDRLSVSLSEKIRLAERILRGMSLSEGFARIVLFAGHRSATTDTYSASALECSACGGQAGEMNARLAAELLNDRFVRAALLGRGIDIPADTVFIAALYDATTDVVSLLDTECATENHRTLLEELQAGLEAATAKVRAERVDVLCVAPCTRAGRAADGSQVLTERRLAGYHAFIAAPRAHTRSLTLDGNSFLHEYRHQQDVNYRVLETILTGPLVAAGWITLQYYGSIVDTRHFGSGNKTLHDGLCGIGVVDEVAVDPRCDLHAHALPRGRRFIIDEPLRLTAVIEAPRAAIDAIIQKHQNLALLVDNGWIQMHAIDAQRRLWRRPRGGGEWTRIETESAARGKQSEAA